MAGSIGLISGFLVADGSMIKAYNDSFDKYNIEDGHFRLNDSLSKENKKGDSIAKIADDLVEDEIVISPIYKMVKESEDTERDIYQRVTCSHHLNP